MKTSTEKTKSKHRKRISPYKIDGKRGRRDREIGRGSSNYLNGNQHHPGQEKEREKSGKSGGKCEETVTADGEVIGFRNEDSVVTLLQFRKNGLGNGMGENCM